MQVTKPHLALLASPGMGHIIPTLELGKSLVTQHDVQVTVFAVGTDASTVQSQLCNFSSPKQHFDIVSLPTVDITSLVHAKIHIKITAMMHESIPALRSAISAMERRPTALIVDLFGTEAMAVAEEFEMLKYVFISSNAWFLAAMIYAPAVDKKLLLDYPLNPKNPLKIPGCTPIRFEDILEPFLQPNCPDYEGLLSVGTKMSKADGILVNTWEDLESKTLRAFKDTNMLAGVAKAPVYPVGPIVRPVASPVLKSELLNWLDKQPNEPVIYVSFGSGGTLSAKQMIELAWGLELSRQRFIWVVRPPMENDVSEFYLAVGNHSARKFDYLPDGFLTRTRNEGLVVPMWAPQTEILGHPSIGGFLSHCGWNSTLESIVHAVPMIAWPLFAEQKMNATMLTEQIRVAVRSKELPMECIIDREEIELMVRTIMVDKQGQAVRSRLEQLKYSAERASRYGGSSYNSLSQVVKKCGIRWQRLAAKGQGA